MITQAMQFSYAVHSVHKVVANLLHNAFRPNYLVLFIKL